MSTVGAIPDMASPGGQEDTLLVDEGGRHADCTGELKALNCQIDHLLSPSQLSYHILGTITRLSSFGFFLTCCSCVCRAIVKAINGVQSVEGGLVFPKLKNKSVRNVMNCAYLL